jgi:hypothetical protein
MTDDPRKPKIIIPEDANFEIARKHKQALEAAAESTKEELPVLDGIFIQGNIQNSSGYLERQKVAVERYIRQQKEKKNG